MRSWLKMSGGAIKAAVSSCSLALVVAIAVAGPQQPTTYTQLDEAIQLRDDAKARQLVAEQADNFPALGKAISKSGNSQKDFGQMRRTIHAFALAEQSVPVEGPKLADAAARARDIKRSSPLYHDGGEKETSNWLSEAFQRLGEWIKNRLEGRDLPKPNVKAPSFFGPWIIYLMWGLLGAILIGFIIFAISRFSWRKKLGRKTALLDDDEPERTLDEWLVMANQLEAEGKFREAVRCLYLACLLKFDEKLVARFDRGQTNWEHLSRIQASPRLPADVDFKAPTQAFDRVWYGHIVEGKADVDRFRAWYSTVVAQLGGVS